MRVIRAPLTETPPFALHHPPRQRSAPDHRHRLTPAKEEPFGIRRFDCAQAERPAGIATGGEFRPLQVHSARPTADRNHAPNRGRPPIDPKLHRDAVRPARQADRKREPCQLSNDAVVRKRRLQFPARLEPDCRHVASAVTLERGTRDRLRSDREHNLDTRREDHRRLHHIPPVGIARWLAAPANGRPDHEWPQPHPRCWRWLLGRASLPPRLAATKLRDRRRSGRRRTARGCNCCAIPDRDCCHHCHFDPHARITPTGAEPVPP